MERDADRFPLFILRHLVPEAGAADRDGGIIGGRAVLFAGFRCSAVLDDADM